MFAENVYQPSAEIDPDNRVAGLIRAMPVCLEADAALMSCKREKREPTTEEASLIAKANALRDILIQVDVHDNIGVDAQTERPALVGTALRQQKAGTSFEAVTGVSAAASA